MSQKYPQQFGKYVLLKKIATGGMAEIFKAKTAGAEGFEKDIVIKRILPHFSEDRSFVKMFIDEASITAKLQHANIVQIFDFDVEAGAYYIAMEYIEGEDLANILKHGETCHRPLSVAQCVAVAMEIAKGLHYAHTKEHKGRPLNIIHRDISPHNAMISYQGEVKLMDFGIAKAAERSTKTQAGTVKGKVAYMSPEQARGKSLDPRSDLFALAIVLWEMITGRRLFLRVSDFETLTAVLKEPAPAPSLHRSGVDQELDDIILQALDKERDYRQESVEAFNRELTRWYYKHVEDLERESLKTYMSSVFADKIAQLRAEAAGASVQAPNTGRRKDPRARTSGLYRKGTSSPKLRRARSNPHARARSATPPPGRLRRVERAEISEPAMTIEEPVPEILKAALPRRETLSQPAVSGKPKPPPVAEFFSSPETMLEDEGPSREEIMQVLAEQRQRARPPGPDLTLNGEGGSFQDEPKSRTGLIVTIALAMLILGGLVAFLLAP